MENTNQPFALDTNADFMLNAFMNAVNQHIDKRIEKRLTTINEAAITDYVNRAVAAQVKAHVEASIRESLANTQVMSTLDLEFERKVKTIVHEAVEEHKQSEDHPTTDDIRNTVEDMDLTDNLTAKVEEIVGDVDLSSNLESAIEAYLTDNHYASVDYVDEKMDNLEDADGFKSAVKDVVKDMNFEITVARY